jgi:hypothetical protein
MATKQTIQQMRKEIDMHLPEMLMLLSQAGDDNILLMSDIQRYIDPTSLDPDNLIATIWEEEKTEKTLARKLVMILLTEFGDAKDHIRAIVNQIECVNDSLSIEIKADLIYRNFVLKETLKKV